MQIDKPIRHTAIQAEIFWLKADGLLDEAPKNLTDAQRRIWYCMKICGADAWDQEEKASAWKAAISDYVAAKEHWEAEAIGEVWNYRAKKEMLFPQKAWKVTDPI